jgi:hypothetical protein
LYTAKKKLLCACHCETETAGLLLWLAMGSNHFSVRVGSVWQRWLSICGRVKSDDKRCSTCCLSNYLERAPCRASVHKCLEMGSMEAKKRMIMDKRFAWADAEARLRGFEYLAWQRAAALKAARCTWKGQVQPQAAKLSPSRSIVSGVPWFRCQQCPPDFNTATILLGHQMFGIYQL